VKSVDPKLTTNEHFLLKELCPQKYQCLAFHYRTPNSKTPFTFTVDGCFAQGYAFKCLGCTHSICCFPTLCLFFRQKSFFL